MLRKQKLFTLQAKYPFHGNYSRRKDYKIISTSKYSTCNVWLNLVVNQINSGLTTQKLGLGFRFANGILFGLENIIIIWLGAVLVLQGNFTVGILIAFLLHTKINLIAVLQT